MPSITFFCVTHCLVLGDLLCSSSHGVHRVSLARSVERRLRLTYRVSHAVSPPRDPLERVQTDTPAGVR